MVASHLCAINRIRSHDRLWPRFLRRNRQPSDRSRLELHRPTLQTAQENPRRFVGPTRSDASRMKVGNLEPGRSNPQLANCSEREAQQLMR